MSRFAVSIRVLGIVQCLFLLSVPVSAADVHVAKSGNDEIGVGSAVAPFLTIGRGVLAAKSGDTIRVHGGVYCESVRILLPDITLTSADNEWAVIQSVIAEGESPRFCLMFDVDASGGVVRRMELVGGYYSVFLQTRFDWGGPDRSGASDILVEDCKIHDSGRDCIKVTPNCDRVTVRRCEIFNSGQLYPPGTPDDNKNAEGIDNVNADQMVVQDCYVHDTATTGVYFKGGSRDCVVERTRVARCGRAGILLGFDTSPEFFDLAANPGYYECVNGVVRNCHVEDTQYAGIGVFSADGALVANNTIVRTARLGHCPIYFGIVLQDYDPAAGRPPSRNARIRNNIVLQPADVAAPMVGIRFTEELGGLAGLSGSPVMSNNLYFASGAALRFSDARPGSVLDKGSLADWQAHIGGDRDSFSADPFLAADGRLTAASPAIDRAAVLADVRDDLDTEARPAGAAPDIGADEFSAAPPAGRLSFPAAAERCPGVQVGPQRSDPDEPIDSGNRNPSGGSGTQNQSGGDGSGRSDGNQEGVAGAIEGAVMPGGLCPMAATAMLAMAVMGLCGSKSRRSAR